MKSEPDTRLENGIDVSFPIEKLMKATKPEPWTGVRNYAARNHMMNMRKGDLAFFYHSSCKVPGVVGIMEVVGEATPDGKQCPSQRLK
jgi:predicted RNA-binding protein with PUA-like domain